jgi:hypothetical protein
MHAEPNCSNQDASCYAGEEEDCLHMEEAMSMTKKELRVGTMEAVSAEMMLWRDFTWHQKSKAIGDTATTDARASAAAM